VSVTDRQSALGVGAGRRPARAVDRGYVWVGFGRAIYFVGVAASLFCLLIPLVLVMWLSVFESEIPAIPPSGYTFGWYGKALANKQFTGGAGLSFEVALLATLVGLGISIPASLALHRGRVPFSGAIVQFLMSPMILPAIVIGAGLYAALTFHHARLEAKARHVLATLQLGGADAARESFASFNRELAAFTADARAA